LARPSPLLLYAAEATPIYPMSRKWNSRNFALMGISFVKKFEMVLSIAQIHR
jgi:hypothetical protein